MIGLEWCEIYGSSGYSTDLRGETLVSVNIVGHVKKWNQNDSNDYNQNWQSQSKYSWGNNQVQPQELQL